MTTKTDLREQAADLGVDGVDTDALLTEFGTAAFAAGLVELRKPRKQIANPGGYLRRILQRSGKREASRREEPSRSNGPCLCLRAGEIVSFGDAKAAMPAIGAARRERLGLPPLSADDRESFAA